MDRDHKNRVEAILFTTGKFMDVEEIAKLCKERYKQNRISIEYQDETIMLE